MKYNFKQKCSLDQLRVGDLVYIPGRRKPRRIVSINLSQYKLVVDIGDVITAKSLVRVVEHLADAIR
jgi:hypothetical protein